jgi:hypothetical protein
VATQSRRSLRYSGRRWSAETKSRFELDATSILKLNRRAQRTITSLERHLKRANRLALKSNPDDFAAKRARWKKHLRWMRLHLTYFKALTPVLKGRKTIQQRTLDELVLLAEHGLRNENLQPPDDFVLRRLMRMYVRSARRGREQYTPRYILENKRTFTGCWYLAKFVERRSNLKPL